MIQPTTLLLGEKANKLLHLLAQENGIASKYFMTKLIVRDARSEATMLSSDKLEKRLKLIAEVEDELVDIINNPPKVLVADVEYSTNPRSIYSKVWAAHKRLSAKGWDEDSIHLYCVQKYGMDFDIKDTPTKSPKRNPDWVGGGAVAEKIKKAKQISVEMKDDQI